MRPLTRVLYLVGGLAVMLVVGIAAALLTVLVAAYLHPTGSTDNGWLLAIIGFFAGGVAGALVVRWWTNRWAQVPPQ